MMDNIVNSFNTKKISIAVTLMANSLFSANLWASNLFIADFSNGTIGEYTTSGATINSNLITGVNLPVGIAASGSNLFVGSIATQAI